MLWVHQADGMERKEFFFFKDGYTPFHFDGITFLLLLL